MSVLLTGIGVSRGIAIGAAYLLRRDQLEIPEYCIPPQRIDEEVARLTHALTAARSQLKRIQDRIPGETPADIRAFIDTHLLMLEDSSFAEVPARLIRTERMNAEWALKQQRDAVVRVFEDMDDPYLRTRRDDVDHVVNRIQHLLLNESNQVEETDRPMAGRIVIADDLTPADTVVMQHQGVSAFVMESGGPLSHTAILARSLGIPAIVGTHHAWRFVRDHETVVVDGRAGAIVVDPDERSLRYYRRQQREARRYFTQLVKLKGEPAITRDRRKITLHANIELPEDLRAVRQVGAGGVGLYRTEFLFMNRENLPDEKEQLEAYVNVVRRLRGSPVTIRSLDLGADKDDAILTTRAVNPALGLRAIRLCLKDPTLFLPQLRAILRASAYGPVRLMIPMLSNAHEIYQILALVADAKRALRREGISYDEAMPIGAMIEVPAAALCAHHFADHLDFLSIGTNDLIQYTLAIDRVDDSVNYLYDPLHPAVLRLIHMTLQAGRHAGIPVSMCGEMAGDPRLTRLLLGLGLTEFSMQPAAILEIKKIVNDADVRALESQAKRILRSRRPEETWRLIERLNAA
ncbi:MAG: phosphoenolpyruvate--protein phosphotransferase [Gammaproteobacteria bacterium]|nr:phosphoenolpyruvate--protein phosphotransferase [Gammaproteobacteria bacterium]NIR82886.1 phosphoenolpyruvate--protein phosphotransferase [Gammaproteobacteria bacterium]NIR89998.1 phosphoenolpyruvate--protein phosphotransferase [Gammaproteobacteria bacterium]NIU03478.1 phosphoenolpyruvate--protein phosphotransferase [Gammaproteobacteria bacterium]NIV50997.1 phosphoenolpyruvate--protein phosphotransferase [Gammaproteobacteria bacterium]